MRVRTMKEGYSVSDLPYHRVFPVADKTDGSDSVLENITVKPSDNKDAMAAMRADKQEAATLNEEIATKEARLAELKAKL